MYEYYSACTCVPMCVRMCTYVYVCVCIYVPVCVCVCRFEVQFVLVLVKELVTFKNGTFRPPMRPLESYTLDELLMSTLVRAQSRSRRQVNDGGVVYIAANLTQEQLSSDFSLGDGQEYGGFSNYPLIPGVRYQVGYRGSVPGTDTPLYLSPPEPIG